MATTIDRRALGVLILGAGVIGWSPILVRLGGTGPAATGVWRLLFALPWLALMAIRSRATPEVTAAVLAPSVVVAGVFFAADLGFWHYGIHLTSVANATVLSNLTPILVTTVAWLVLKERPRRTFLLGMAIAVAGAVGMAAFKADVGHRPPNYVGDGLSALTAVWYGAYFLVVRQARARFSTTAVMVGSALPGIPLLLIGALVLREPLTPATTAGWVALAALGLMHATGQGAIAWALGRLPTALAAVVVLVQPVVAALLGWMVFGEAMTALQALSAALALAGVAVAQASARRPEPGEGPDA